MKRFLTTFSIFVAFATLPLVAHAITWNDVKQHFNISGYIQTSYNLEVSESRIESSTFRIRRARVSFAGNIFKLDRWGMADYRLQVDFASSPQIVDAWVRYRPLNQLGLQLGQFKVPLSIENSEYTPLQLEFIDYSLVVQRLVRMSANDVTGISSTGRDCGAQLYGSFFARGGFNIVNYNLALFNGNGLNRVDNNHSKDFVGRVMVNPIRDVTIAGYYQYGEGNFGKSEYVCYQRYGGGVAYEGRHAFARAEYIGGITGSLHSEGAYASAGWKFHTAKSGEGSVGARFDYFDEDVYTSAREFNYTIGVTYQPLKYLRLQLNYALKHYPHQDRALANVLSVMVSGIF